MQAAVLVAARAGFPAAPVRFGHGLLRSKSLSETRILSVISLSSFLIFRKATRLGLIIGERLFTVKEKSNAYLWPICAVGEP